MLDVCTAEVAWSSKAWEGGEDDGGRGCWTSSGGEFVYLKSSYVHSKDKFVGVVWSVWLFSLLDLDV